MYITLLQKKSRRGAPTTLPPAPPRRFRRHVCARDDVVLQIAERALEVVRAVERSVDALAAGPRHPSRDGVADERQARPAPRALRRRRREERRERERADDVARLPHRVARREQHEVAAGVEGVLVAAVVAEPQRAVRELERAGACLEIEILDECRLDGVEVLLISALVGTDVLHADAAAGKSSAPRRLSRGRSTCF